LGGSEPGYVYARDGHPNAARLAEACRKLHDAPRAAVTNSGMSALALAMVTACKAGDHVLLSKHLYGRTAALFAGEAARLGISATVVDTFDPAAPAAAWQSNTRLLVVETITNPLVRLNDIPTLAALCQARGGELLVDNTLAGPLNFRPLAHGAAWVVESLTKIMNGHSDVLLGLLCGREERWERVPGALSTWGWTAPPFECWLAERGLATLPLRWRAASQNALAVAQFLARQPTVKQVLFAGLSSDPDYALAKKLFGDPPATGTLVAFTLDGGWAGATRFIAAVRERIPFCPSLGELHTTLSHPASTSHRGLSPEERTALGIDDGLIRLSVGVEDAADVIARLQLGLSDLGN